MSHQTWRPRRAAIIASLLLLTGFLILPIAVYVFGQRVVGPYEGDGGLGIFLWSIYTGLARGAFAAWILVLSPALVVGVWYALVKFLRAARRRATAANA